MGFGNLFFGTRFDLKVFNIGKAKKLNRYVAEKYRRNVDFREAKTTF